MPPLICTSNSQCHVDYGIPLTAGKSTDYRTSTGTYHRSIPNNSQHFDCRVKPRIKKGLFEKDVAVRDYVKSTYTNDYFLKFKPDEISTKYERALSADRVLGIRNIQEKISKDPPIATETKISEMKDCYRMNSYKSLQPTELLSPALYAKCEIRGLDRPMQPIVPPGEKGYWKYLDIYMTENKLQYVPFNEDQIEKSKTDIITYYSGTGQYKKAAHDVPVSLNGNSTIFDKQTFKNQYPNRFLSKGQKRCPHFGMKSEYQSHYKLQTYSNLSPYINEHGVAYEESLPGAGPWQNLCPPGMYCSEYCHIGTGWPIRAVVDAGKARDHGFEGSPCNV